MGDIDQMNANSFEIRPARTEDYPELMQMMSRCYAADGSPAFDFSQAYCDLYQPQDEEMSWQLTMRCHDRIIASIGVFPLFITAGDQTFEIGGIGGVGTLPEYRRQGCMGRLLDEATRLMTHQRQYALAWLAGYRRRYRPWGYETVPNTLELELSSRGPGIGDFKDFTRWNIRRTSTDQMDWTALWDQLAKVPYFAACGPEKLQLKYQRLHHPSCSIWHATNAKHTGHILAADDGCRILSWAGAPQAIGAILTQRLLEDSWSPRVLIPCRRDRYYDVFDKLCCVQRRIIPHGSIAILNLEKLLHTYRGHIDKRISTLKLKGSVQFTMEGCAGLAEQSAFLEADGRESHIASRPSTSSNIAQIRLTPCQAVELFFSHTADSLVDNLEPRAQWVGPLGPLPFYAPTLYDL